MSENPPQPQDAHRQQAIQSFKRRDWQGAVDSAERAIALDAPLPRIYELIGIAVLARGHADPSSFASVCRRYIGRLEAAADCPRERLSLWQMSVAVAVSCGDSRTALELFHRPGAPVGKLAAQAESIEISPVASVEQWAAEHRADRRVLEAASRVTIDATPGPTSRWDYPTDPFFVTRIPNAEILCGWDFVRTAQGVVLSDSGYTSIDVPFPDFFPHSYARGINRVGHMWGNSVQAIDEDALFLSTPEQFHFGHWIVDFLPRLRAIDGDRKIRAAIPAALPAKHVETLAGLGFPEERLLRCELGRRYRFRNLIVAQPGLYLRPSAGNVRYIGDRFLAPGAAGGGRKKFFVSRRANSRLITNQADLDRVLARHGFETIDLAAMSISAQRQALSQAAIIVGVFGSDLLGCYFAAPGTHVIELTWDPATDPVIGPTCHLLGQKHYFLRSAEVAPRFMRMKKDRDLLVDCAALDALLAQIAANP